MEEMEKLVIEVDQRSKSNTHRLNDLEKTMKAIYDLSASVQVMGHNVQTLAEEIRSQGDRLEQLEKVPSDRWEMIMRAVLTTLVGALIGYMLK